MSVDEQIKQNIGERIAKLKRGDAKKYSKTNIFYPGQEKESDLKKIQDHIPALNPQVQHYGLVVSDNCSLKTSLGVLKSRHFMGVLLIRLMITEIC